MDEKVSLNHFLWFSCFFVNSLFYTAPYHADMSSVVSQSSKPFEKKFMLISLLLFFQAYQVVKVKSPVSGVVDTFPQLTIKGVGFVSRFQYFFVTSVLCSLLCENQKKKLLNVSISLQLLEYPLAV